MAAPAALWSVGRPTFTVGTNGTLTAAVPVLDNKVLAATLTFTLTADRALELVVTSASGAAGLTDFQAWSTT